MGLDESTECFRGASRRWQHSNNRVLKVSNEGNIWNFTDVKLLVSSYVRLGITLEVPFKVSEPSVGK